MVPSVVPAVVSTILDALLLNAPYGYAYHCEKYKADDCSLENASLLTGWYSLLLAACTLKQVKMGHRICPEMPVAPKSGAVRSEDFANLLVLAP